MFSLRARLCERPALHCKVAHPVRPVHRLGPGTPWLGLLLLLGSIGCTYIREAIGLDLRRPQMALADISLDRITMESIGLTLAMRIDNPNDFALEFARLEYQIQVDQRDLAQGTYAKTIALPAEGRTLVKLPLTVKTSQAMALVGQLLQKDHDVMALVRAKVDFITPLGGIAVHFEDQKNLRRMTGL